MWLKDYTESIGWKTEILKKSPLILNTVMDLMGNGKQVELFWFSKHDKRTLALLIKYQQDLLDNAVSHSSG